MRRLLALLITIAGLLHAEVGDTVIPYPFADTADGTRFVVTVNGVRLPTIDMSLPGSGCSLARFAFTGQARVQVRVADGWAASAILSPKKYDIPATISGDTVSFTLDRPRKLVLRGPGDRPLLLLVAEAPEADAPAPGQAGVVDVATHGADATGASEATAALQQAIDACPSGGTLYIGPGIYSIGQLDMKSDLTVYLAPGSVLRGRRSLNPSYGSGMLTGTNVANVRIRGHGAIDGQGMYWRYHGGWFALISFTDASNIRIEDVFCRNPCVNFTDASNSTGVTLRNVVLVADTDYENTDGIDCDGRDILIEDCLIWNTDASIAPTGSSGVACQDLTARNCVLRGPIINYPSLELGDPLLTMSDFTYENLDWPTCNEMVTMWPIAGASLSNHWYKNLRVESWFDWTSTLSDEPYAAKPMSCRIMVGNWEPKSRDDKLGFIHDQFFRGLRFDVLPGEAGTIGGWDATRDVTIDFQDFLVGGSLCTSPAAGGLELIDTYKVGTTGTFATLSFGSTVTPEVGIDAASPYARRGGAPITVTVQRGGSTALPLTVSLLVGGNALAGVDYEALPASVSFAAGSAQASVTVRALGSGPSRALVVGLSNEKHAATWTLGGRFHAMVTITPAQTISGRVTLAGAGVTGVAVSDGLRIATTAGDGSYTITGVPAGSYTLTATAAGYAFAPAGLLAVVGSANLTGRNFMATVIDGGSGTPSAGTPASGFGGGDGKGGCGFGLSLAAVAVMLAMLRSRRA